MLFRSACAPLRACTRLLIRCVESLLIGASFYMATIPGLARLGGWRVGWLGALGGGVLGGLEVVPVGRQAEGMVVD